MKWLCQFTIADGKKISLRNIHYLPQCDLLYSEPQLIPGCPRLGLFQFHSQICQELRETDPILELSISQYFPNGNAIPKPRGTASSAFKFYSEVCGGVYDMRQIDPPEHSIDTLTMQNAPICSAPAAKLQLEEGRPNAGGYARAAYPIFRRVR